MNTIKRTFLKTAGILALSTAILSASVGTAVAGQAVRIATEPLFPPFEFVDTKTGELTGFEIEIVREIAKEAGFEADFKVYGFDAIIPALLTNTVEMGAAGFAMTEERKKRILFSEPFFQTGLSVIVQNKDADRLKTMEDLGGRTIGVQIGSTSHIAAKKIAGATVKTFNSAGDAVLELANGGVDAVINDRTATAYLLMQQPKFNKVLTLQPHKYKATDLGFAFPKSSTELCNKVNAALAKIKADGRYDAIYKKWFGNH